MLIVRCAWHAFFCGYPRPLRVISWRGRGVSFSDTICPSCAERVRIEGLWGTSPPTPVWPGSAQTALIFVGLPLLTALVLLATPLHDVAPSPPRDQAVTTLAGELATPEPHGADVETGTAAMPRAVASRAAEEPDVPAVIYERRRMRHPALDQASPAESGSRPAVLTTRTTDRGARPARAPEHFTLAAATAVGGESRAMAASLAPQSP